MTRRAERKVWDRSGGWGPVQTCLGLSRPGGSLSRQFNPIREKLLLSSAKWSKWSKSMRCSRLTQPHASTFQRLSGWRGTSCALRKTVWNKKFAFTSNKVLIHIDIDLWASEYKKQDKADGWSGYPSDCYNYLKGTVWGWSHIKTISKQTDSNIWQ